jgi:hypothetical protein
MKLIIKKIFLLILLLYTPLFSSIDEQIEAMQHASDAERFEMMNQFKKELVKLQEEERIHAMKKLISITESNNSHEVMEELKNNSDDQNNSYENNILEEYIEDTIKNDMEENIEFESQEEGEDYD